MDNINYIEIETCTTTEMEFDLYMEGWEPPPGFGFDKLPETLKNIISFTLNAITKSKVSAASNMVSSFLLSALHILKGSIQSSMVSEFVLSLRERLRVKIASGIVMKFNLIITFLRKMIHTSSIVQYFSVVADLLAATLIKLEVHDPKLLSQMDNVLLADLDKIVIGGGGFNPTIELDSGTAVVTVTSPDSTFFTYDWRINGVSIAQLNVHLGTAGALDLTTFSQVGTGVQGSPNHVSKGSDTTSPMGTGYLEFSGTAQFVNYGSWDWPNEDQTVVTIAKPDATAGNSIILGQTANAVVNPPWFTWCHGIYYNLLNYRTGWQSINAGSLTYGNWIRNISTRDDGYIKVYIDGVDVGTTGATGAGNILASPTDVLIASEDNYTGICFKGDIQMVIAYSRVISHAQRAFIDAYELNKLHANELNVGESVTCHVTGYDDSGAVVESQLSNAIVIT